MTLEQAAQVGDFLGGVFAVLAFVAVLVTAVRVVPAEMAKFRAQKRAEIIASVAERVWEAVFRLSVALEAVCSPVSRGPEPQASSASRGEEFLRAWHPRLSTLTDAGNRYVEAWGLAEMYLEPRHLQSLAAFWNLRAAIVVDLEMYARNLDTPGVADDAWARVFGGQAIKEVQAQRAALKDSLRELAHVEAPRNPKGKGA